MLENYLKISSSPILLKDKKTQPATIFNKHQHSNTKIPNSKPFIPTSGGFTTLSNQPWHSDKTIYKHKLQAIIETL